MCDVGCRHYLSSLGLLNQRLVTSVEQVDVSAEGRVKVHHRQGS